MIIGIDPGQTGAISSINGNGLFGVVDMPVVERVHGKGKQVDAVELAKYLGHFDRIEQVTIEAVSAMPGQGVTSMFRFGESFGVILGVCGALELPIRLVTAAKWKRAAGLIGKPKDAARTLVIQRYPSMADMFKFKKNVGRADAVLIAEFGGIN